MSSNPCKYFQQSGAVPVLDGKVVLVTTRNSGRWIVPKGFVEPDMTPHESAAKEALEEAGVVGSVGDEELGSYSYAKWGGICIVQVYPLVVEKVLGEWEDMHVRKRTIVAPADAVDMIRNKELARIVFSFFRYFG